MGDGLLINGASTSEIPYTLDLDEREARGWFS
jgi:hypothetical protein